MGYICQQKTFPRFVQTTFRPDAYAEGGGGGGKGDALGAGAPSHMKKISAQKRPKEERNSRPDMSARENARFAQIRKFSVLFFVNSL